LSSSFLCFPVSFFFLLSFFFILFVSVIPSSSRSYHVGSSISKYCISSGYSDQSKSNKMELMLLLLRSCV
jgi:hypothetical protein